MSKHLSDSSEQITAEAYVLRSLQKELGLHFDPDAKLPIDVGVKPDAIDPINKVIVEVYARVGQVKGGQQQKIKGDILKLALIDKILGEGWKKVLCFVSADAAKYVQGGSWVAEAARAFSVEIRIVTLPPEIRHDVEAAQTRQRMVNPS